MTQRAIPAVFIRGGTSKGVFFHARDLPVEQQARDALFLTVLGSPDPYERQLNGMGGGLSSLSKAVIVATSSHPDADIDYTFAQVAVDRPLVDYSSTCGNLSSAIGPFAVDEGLVDVTDGDALVRVLNTNTGKIYHARFAVRAGKAVVAGDFCIPGVAGSGAPIQLDYLDPGGAVTGRLLPSGHPCDLLDVANFGAVEVSLVDATNALVLVRAEHLGLDTAELPEVLERDASMMARLDAIRRAAGVRMGLGATDAAINLASPVIAILGSPGAFTSLDGKKYSANTHDLSVRLVSMQRVHRAITLTGAMCIAAARCIDGTIARQLAPQGGELRIGNPSGVLPVDARVHSIGTGNWQADYCRVYRTQRRLMEGSVLV